MPSNKSFLSRELINKMREYGVMPKDIASFIGCHHSQLYRVRPDGIPMLTIKTRKPPGTITDNELERARKMYENDLNASQICKQLNLNIHPVTLRKKLKEIGVVMHDSNHSRTFRLSRDEEINLIKLYNYGISIAELSRQFKVDQMTLRKYLSKRGIKIRNRSESQIIESGSLMNSHTKQQIISMRKQGIRVIDIANRLGINHAVIRTFLYKNGLTNKRKKTVTY